MKGDAGVQGLQGVKGDTGAQGPQGIQGDKGDTGAQGVQGVKGDTGAQGVQGVKGDTGAQGVQGVKGDTGAQGMQGVKGDTGAQGPQGPQGVQGATGADGQGQTVLIGWDMDNVAEGCHTAVPASDRRPGIHGDMKYRGIANDCGTTVGAFNVANWSSHNAVPSYTNPNDYPYLTLATTESVTIQQIRLQSHTNNFSGAEVPMDVWISPATGWGMPVPEPPAAGGLAAAGYTHLGTYNAGNFAQYGVYAVKKVNTSTTVAPGIYHIVLVPQVQVVGYMQFDNLQLIGKVQ